MGSFKHPRAFGPLDLEIFDLVYEAAWAALEARDPFRDTEKDGARQQALRKLVMDNTGTARSISTPSAEECWPICPRTGLCSEQLGLGAPKGADRFIRPFSARADKQEARAMFSLNGGQPPSLGANQLVREPDLPEKMSNTDVLAWMGRAFGDAVEHGKPRLESLIQALPAAIYTTDAAGRITFFNEAAAELWGCRPELGKSEFCGSWKLYWLDGRPLPHDECPMALVLKEQRDIRGLEAVVERPDGTLVHVVPYPTPLYDNSGTLIGAVNMVVDISDRRRADLDAQRLASIVEIIRRCDYQQGSRRHHHKLESRCRAAVRLYSRRGHRQTGHDPHSRGSHE